MISNGNKNSDFSCNEKQNYRAVKKNLKSMYKHLNQYFPLNLLRLNFKNCTNVTAKKVI